MAMSRMFNLLIGAALIVSACVFYPFMSVADNKVPAAEALESIKANGAQATVDALMKSGKWRSTFLPGVRAGDSKWLSVAQSIRPDTDAGAREDLDEALTSALLKVPYKVLPILKAAWWAQDNAVCSFDEDSELPGGVKNYVEHLRKALKKPSPAGRESLRDACLRGIDMTISALQKKES